MIRTALVTGAGQGIGRAIALRLAKDGFNVVVNDINTNESKLQEVQEEIKKLGRRSMYCLADVSNSESVEQMMEMVAQQMGSLDVVVANAGIFQVKKMLDMTVEEWDHMFAVNTRGIFLCYKEAAKVMIKQGRGGKLISACSVVAYKAAADLAHYSASKWGVRGLTQAAALEWAPYKITVNSYCPGLIKTSLGDTFIEELSKNVNKSPENFAQALINDNPLGRIGTPEDVANLVSFLASEQSDFITGQNILVTGGSLLS